MIHTQSRVRDGDAARLLDATVHTRLLDSIRQAVVVTDLDGTISYWNRFAESLYGFSADEAVGRSILDVTPTETALDQCDVIMTILASGEPCTGEVLVRRRDGTAFWVEVSTTPIFEDGLLAGIINVSTDITERKQAEAALRDSEERFRSAFDDADTGQAIVGFDGQFLRVNASLCALVGYTADELTGMNYRDITHPDDNDAIEALDGDSTVDTVLPTFSFEKRYIHKDGHHPWVQVTSSVVHDTDGQPLYRTSQVLDITERKVAEERTKLLARISSRLQESLDPETTLTTLVTALVPAVADWCSVALVEDDGSLRRVAVVHADPAKASLAADLMQFPLDRDRASGLAAAIRSGQSIIDSEVRIETWRARLSPNLLRVHQGLGITAQMHVPLVVRGRVIGGIAFFVGDSGRRYTKADLTFVEEVARRAALAIDNARLHHDLRESEAKHRSLIEHLPAVTFIEYLGTPRRFYMSPPVEVLIGYPPSCWIDNPDFMQTIMHPDDVSAFQDSIQRTDASGETFDVECRLIHRDGETVWVHNKAVLIRGEDGTPSHWQGFIDDVTARRQAEDKVQRAETRYRTLVEQIAGAVYQYGGDSASPSLYMSPQIETITGYPPTRWHHDPNFGMRIVHPEDRDLVTNSLNAALHAGQTFDIEYRYVRPDGELVWARNTCTVVEQGIDRAPLWQGIIVDITEHKRAEETTAELAAVVTSAMDAIMTADRAGMITSWNGAAERLFGYSHDEMLGQPTSMIVPDAQRADFLNNRASVLSGDPVVHRETLRQRKDGSLVDVAITVSGIPNADGDVIGTSAVLRDITERRQAEADLRESEAKYRTLVDTIPAVTYTEMLDGTGTVFVSPQVMDMLGYAPDAWAENPSFTLTITHPDDIKRVRAEVHRTDATGEPFDVEQRCIKPNGDVVWCHNRAVLHRDHTGTPLFWQGFIVDITEQKQLQAQLTHQAFHDALTGLPNRALFLDRLEHAIRRSARKPSDVAVVFIDLDNFKVVNDSLGHVAGDALLVKVGRCLSSMFREIDTVARLGGDEFTILIEDAGGLRQVLRATERIMAALREPVMIGQRPVTVTASIGIALGGEAKSAEDVIRHADLAMYTAKGTGKGRVAIFNPAMHRQALHRLEIEHELRAAIAAGDLSVRYQPEIILATGAVFGVEALVRWEHPTSGTRLPADFIAVAEETGLIIPLGAWVLRRACVDAAKWLAAFDLPDTFALSVNLSPRQFRDPELVSVVEQALSTAGLHPSRLILEITESILADEPEQVAETLHRLCDLGLQIAVDDFGTGYSSLGRLRHVPVDFLKIDRSFIAGIGTDTADTALVRSMIDLGHALETQVVAEGVETAAQATLLHDLGCDVAQGYLYAKPLPECDIATLLESIGIG